MQYIEYVKYVSYTCMYVCVGIICLVTVYSALRYNLMIIANKEDTPWRLAVLLH